jgi:ribonuclease BN (tRNA processing enzyme)
VTTVVTLTGTGVPHPSPGRAGPGTLVRCGDTALQFDAGRGTVLRLAEAGCGLHELSAVFLTHVHSDHVVDLTDVVMTREVGHLVLTHLIPPPTTAEAEADFAADIRRGGYPGPLTVGRDLASVELHAPRRAP